MELSFSSLKRHSQYSIPYPKAYAYFCEKKKKKKKFLAVAISQIHLNGVVVVVITREDSYLSPLPPPTPPTPPLPVKLPGSDDIKT